MGAQNYTSMTIEVRKYTHFKTARFKVPFISDNCVLNSSLWLEPDAFVKVCRVTMILAEFVYY